MPDYRFYTDSYLGSRIPEKHFSEMLCRARDALQRFRYIYTVAPCGPEAEAMALCAMAEAAYDRRNHSAGVQYASAGGVTVRYDRADRPGRAMYDAARIYLDIYRGVKKTS